MTKIRLFIVICLVLFRFSAQAQPVLVAADAVAFGAEVRVRIEGLDRAIKYWVTLVPKNTPDGNWLDYVYVEGTSSQEVVLRAKRTGPHELRLHDNAKGYALYARRPILIGEWAPAGSASVAPARTGRGPCPRMTAADSASVAACLQHLRTTSIAYVFTNATSSCTAMQFQLVLSQRNLEGTRQTLRGFDMTGIVEIDCPMIAAQVEQVFGTPPVWAACMRHPKEAGPLEHIVCAESLPTVGRGDPEARIRMAFPTDCRVFESQLRRAYQRVYPELGDYRTYPSVSGAVWSCEPYRAYLDANQSRQRAAVIDMRTARASERQRAIEQAQAQAALRESFAEGIDQMTRDWVGTLRERRQDPDRLTDADLRWALVKVLHRLEPERKVGPSTMIHTDAGLMLRTGTGRLQTVATHIIRDARARHCEPISGGAATCEVELTTGAQISAPGDEGINLLMQLSGAGQVRTETVTLVLTHDGTQWSLERLDKATFDLLTAAGAAPNQRNSFAFDPYSPEECLWLESMGARGVC